jgi:hypothetical protein
MVQHLEEHGFKTTKKYISERKVYEFRIEKNGVTAVGEYEYIPHLSPAVFCEMQVAFLNSLEETWADAYERSAVFATENPYRRVMQTLDVSRLYPKTILDPAIVLRDEYERNTYEFTEYCRKDVKNTKELYKYMQNINKNSIKDVIFNDPATIVFWTDGTKTVVKCQNNDTFDPEVGLAMAIAKKALGNKGNYCNTIKKWTDKYYEKQKEVEVDDKEFRPTEEV